MILTRFSFFLLLAMLWSSTALAQIRGSVFNATTGEPVPGAHIILMSNDQIGTTTNKEGAFKLSVPRFPARLEISSLGYRSRVVTVFEPEQKIRIGLEPVAIEGDPLLVEAQRIPVDGIDRQSLPITTVSGAELTSKSTNTAVDLLRAESGVFIQQTSIGQGSVYIRGRAGRDVLYLFNGLRMNPSFVRSGQNQYFGSVDPFSVKELDVFRGPVSVYYGSDALSGGVNIIPQQATFRDSETEAPFVTHIIGQTNVGGTGEYSGHADFNYRSSKFAIRLGGTIRDFSYYNMSDKTDQSLWFPYTDSKLDDAAYQQYSYNLSAKWKIQPQSVLSFHSYYNTLPDAPRYDRMTMGYSIKMDSPPSSPRLAYFSNTSPMVFSAHTLSFTHTYDAAWLQSLNIRAGYHRLRDDRKSIAYEIEPLYPTNPAFRGEPYALFDDNTSSQALASIDVVMKPWTDFKIRTGFDAGYDYIESTRYYDYTNLNGQLQNPPALPQASLPRYPDGSSYERYGLFTHAEYNPTERWHLQGGLRFAFYRADLAFEGVNTVRGYNPYKQTYSQLTGSLGALYRISDSWSVFGNVSTGFRAPNVADLAELGSRRSQQYQTANVDLKPEQSLNTDLGVRLSNTHWTAELAGFWLHYFDKIKRFDTGRIVDGQGIYLRDGSTPADNSEYVEVIARNATAMNLLGTEFSVEWDSHNDWRAGGTFSYTRGTLINTDDSTQPVDRIPPANGWAWLAYDGIPNISLRPQMRYAFAHRRISPDEVDDNRVSPDGTDGFVNLQMVLEWKVNEAFTVIARGDNLTNAAYREHASSLDGLARNVTFTIKATL
jgi:hemoglobin/transferrin/lactoferrin receptor protein